MYLSSLRKIFAIISELSRYGAACTSMQESVYIIAQIIDSGSDSGGVAAGERGGPADAPGWREPENRAGMATGPAGEAFVALVYSKSTIQHTQQG